MTAIKREVTWGQALRVEVADVVGGLEAVTAAIGVQLGALADSRNTFARLLKVDDPSQLNDVDQWRAWLVLSTVGVEPSDWGIAETAVPRYMNREALKLTLRSSVHRRGLEPRTRWLSDDMSMYVLGGRIRRVSRHAIIPTGLPERPTYGSAEFRPGAIAA